jgi:hypothetical protein
MHLRGRRSQRRVHDDHVALASIGCLAPSMENPMKRSTWSIIALICVLALHGGSAARADTLQTRTFVPFDFTAGATTLRAGTYVVKRVDGTAAIIEVRSARGAVFLASHEETANNRTPGEPRMVFHRYGNRYFLREVWVSDSRGYPLRESQAERELMNAQHSVAARVTLPLGESR